MYKLTIDQMYEIWLHGLLEGADDEKVFDVEIIAEIFTQSLEPFIPKSVLTAWLKERKNAN